MSPTSDEVPEGFGPILRSSPVLEALGGFMSRGEGPDLEVGLCVGPNHLNARGGMHGGVIATLLDVATGYMLVARSGGKRRVTARLTVDYRSGARAGEWLQVHLDRTEEDGRKTLAHARLMAGERLVAEASVLFIDASPARD
ncbi:MAG: PaaI family thioesterase [Phenylobacterium sp.]|uniref:PaaI family thioesterase n=1 Tax=Phenylobacterium sp. TaxID=1871053 RepID=UPI0025EA4DDD|nr:PaaI family thioesterase [Phenylobacterium sp.]MCA3757591.1 PaaI family thioesterase [Phenylobacterium sp.]MCA6254562.1 PaaI family thioesterase [Phenylobacterium sp.]